MIDFTKPLRLAAREHWPVRLLDERTDIFGACFQESAPAVYVAEYVLAYTVNSEGYRIGSDEAGRVWTGVSDQWRVENVPEPQKPNALDIDRTLWREANHAPVYIEGREIRNGRLILHVAEWGTLSRWEIDENGCCRCGAAHCGFGVENVP